MKISIVTNAFNQGKFLRRCMESVLRQTGAEIEYIVIDPGSTDCTAAILEEYEVRNDPRLVIIREPDTGPGDGLNKGFERATGDWFIYINADDFFLPGVFEQAATALATHPDADCLYGDGYITDAEGRAVRRVYSTNFSLDQTVLGYTEILQQSTFYRADSYRKVGGFNVANRTSWDWEILVDMALAGMKLAHVPGFWSAFAIYGESITGSQRHAAESKRNHERIFKKVKGRDRTDADLAMIKKRVRLFRLSNPKITLARVMDAKMPQRLPVLTDGLPPLEERTV